MNRPQSPATAGLSSIPGVHDELTNIGQRMTRVRNGLDSLSRTWAEMSIDDIVDTFKSCEIEIKSARHSAQAIKRLAEINKAHNRDDWKYGGTNA